MKLYAIVTLLLAICTKPGRTFHLQDGDCPSIEVPSTIRDVNRNFFHLKTWYVYAHTDPHPSYLSMFQIPQGVSPFPDCMRLHSETIRGLVLIHYHCLNYTELHQFTLYSDNPTVDEYQQTHNYRSLYRVYRRFGTVRVLVTDGESYVVFYGCQKVQHRALIGLLFLVRTDVYDHFIPPPDLIKLLWSKLSFNVSQHQQYPPLSRDQQHGSQQRKCDCRGAIQQTQRMVISANHRLKAKKLAKARMKEHFALGIRNFFVSVFSFMVWLLGVNRIIDRYVFDLKY